MPQPGLSFGKDLFVALRGRVNGSRLNLVFGSRSRLLVPCPYCWILGGAVGTVDKPEHVFRSGLSKQLVEIIKKKMP